MAIPSLTPHLDAFRRARAGMPEPRDDFERAVRAVTHVANEELAKIMDAGGGTTLAGGFTLSCATSIVDTFASSASSAARGLGNYESLREKYLSSCLTQMRAMLSGVHATTEHTESVSNVEQGPEGRA